METLCFTIILFKKLRYKVEKILHIKDIKLMETIIKNMKGSGRRETYFKALVTMFNN